MAIFCKATQRLLDSVWTVTYMREGDNVAIMNFTRDDPDGYYFEKHLPDCKLIEDDKRIVTGLKIEGEASAFTVSNPQHVFDYRPFEYRKLYK